MFKSHQTLSAQLSVGFLRLGARGQLANTCLVPAQGDTGKITRNCSFFILIQVPCVFYYICYYNQQMHNYIIKVYKLSQQSLCVLCIHARPAQQ